jgi:asparagine synthase (glutamine-hydrolysing)
MSGIAGWVGHADRSILDAMLAAIDYRGDAVDMHHAEGIALGYRWWRDRPGKSPGIHRDARFAVACAGTLAPPVASPAADLVARIDGESQRVADLDGAFAAAIWDGEQRRLTLIRDPFGVRSLYFVEHAGTLFFATELKQLLVIPGLPIEPDLIALHKYLTFSFVPGDAVPVKGVRRLLPGHVAAISGTSVASQPYFALKEDIDPALDPQDEAVRAVRRAFDDAVANRLNGEDEVGLFLSGGIDSSGVGVWLKRHDAHVRAFSLDFGEQSVEREQAAEVAQHLGIPLESVKADGEVIRAALMDIVWKLDLPFGDAVTGPQYLLGRAAHAAGLTAVFNGEGGDQLFGGWTSKPMVAAAVYGNLYEQADESPEEQYLRSYHRFYGLEDALYTPQFKQAVDAPGQRRALLRPYLEGDAAQSFLGHVRLADISLKGSQNILPRAERMANAWGLDVRVPLFDRALAELAFRLPPQHKLRGASEKHVLKLALQKALPADIVWRRKYGMSVPSTDWLLGPLEDVVEDLLGDAALASRGLFQSEFVARLRRGEPLPGDTRRRRLGEKLWALLMLEAWLRVFIDGRGARPGSLR